MKLPVENFLAAMKEVDIFYSGGNHSVPTRFAAPPMTVKIESGAFYIDVHSLGISNGKHLCMRMKIGATGTKPVLGARFYFKKLPDAQTLPVNISYKFIFDGGLIRSSANNLIIQHNHRASRVITFC